MPALETATLPSNGKANEGWKEWWPSTVENLQGLDKTQISAGSRTFSVTSLTFSYLGIARDQEGQSHARSPLCVTGFGFGVDVL